MRWKDIFLLNFAIRHLRVRITAGPNRGKLWSLPTSKGFLRGDYEAARVEALSLLFQPGDCFWDVGAHYGYLTLAGASRVGSCGQVYAFEPSNRNLWFLKKHLAWNKDKRTIVLPIAISDHDGVEGFSMRGSGTGRLTSEAQSAGDTVPVRSVDDLIASGTCRPPLFMKVDVEGAELKLLRGAEQTLRGAPVIMVVATHSPELHRQCCELLCEFGFTVYEASRVSKALYNGWHSVKIEPEILAVGYGREVPIEYIEAFVRPD